MQPRTQAGRAGLLREPKRNLRALLPCCSVCAGGGPVGREIHERSGTGEGERAGSPRQWEREQGRLGSGRESWTKQGSTATSR